MKDGIGNETGLAYPEVVEDATDWASGTEPVTGNIVVTKQGLRSLLQLVGDCWPLAAGAFLTLHNKGGGPQDAQEMYGEALSEKGLADVMNRVSKVWCEGDLIVSGLFTHADGTAAINPCAEE